MTNDKAILLVAAFVEATVRHDRMPLDKYLREDFENLRDEVVAALEKRNEGPKTKKKPRGS